MVVLDPRSHGGAVQRRVAVEALLRRGRAARAHDHGRTDARARRLREADGGAGADLGLGAALPADAGLRLGRDRGRRRARRHRPALQPARRPRGDDAVRPRAAGRADDAAPALVGRREDELVGREQHPADGAARRDVRPDDADPRRAARPTGGGSSPSAMPPAGDPMASKLALARWIVARSHGEEAAAGGGGALHARRPPAARRPRRSTEVALPDGDPVHLPALLVASLGVGSTSEARRLIAQGGVKLDGEPVVRARPAAASARRQAAPGRQAALRPPRCLSCPIRKLPLPSPPMRAIVLGLPFGASAS